MFTVLLAWIDGKYHNGQFGMFLITGAVDIVMILGHLGVFDC